MRTGVGHGKALIPVALIPVALIPAAVMLALAGCATTTTPPPANGPVATLPAVSASPHGGPTPAPTPIGPPATITGQLFYISNDSGGGSVPIVSWSPGEAPQSHLALKWIDAYGTAMISPDGTKVAWTQEGGAALASLYVANLDGSGKKSLGKASDYCEATWSPDGTQVFAAGFNGGNGAKLVNVSTGATSSPPGMPYCHVSFSADGSAIGYDNGAGEVYVAKATSTKKIPRLGSDGGSTRRRSFCALSLSPDASLAALSVHTGEMPDGDIGRDLRANEIVNTATGATVVLAGLPGALDEAYFLPSGELIARVKVGNGFKVALYSADLALLTQASEPAALANSRMIGYGGAAA
jgi:hypothetical protein